jgi:hypothetical protein
MALNCDVLGVTDFHCPEAMYPPTQEISRKHIWIFFGAMLSIGMKQEQFLNKHVQQIVREEIEPYACYVFVSLSRFSLAAERMEAR